MVTRVRIKIGTAYWTIKAGSTIMPTEIKKTAPNRSLTGLLNVLNVQKIQSYVVDTLFVVIYTLNTSFINLISKEGMQHE